MNVQHDKDGRDTSITAGAPEADTTARERRMTWIIISETSALKRKTHVWCDELQSRTF